MARDNSPNLHARQAMLVEEVAPQQATLISSNSSSQIKPEHNDHEHSARLRRSGYIIVLTLSYISLATFSWVVTCILTYKPIGAHHYGFVSLSSDNDGYGGATPAQYHSLYEHSERYYRAARVVQSVVAVLTIPLTSAVCARAAVAFLQYGKHSRSMTMRQMMVLADKSWNDPGLVTKLLSGQWKLYGSSFLVGVILLNILGGILSPLQEIFLSTTVIKTPTKSLPINFLVDFSDHFQEQTSPTFDSGIATTLARGKFASTRNTDPQMRLWSRAIDCNSLNVTTPSQLCQLSGGQHTFAEASSLLDPFWSQLPSDFSTGLIRQFMPRINSTAKRENITGDDFPRGCDQIPDALYIRHANVTEDPLSSQIYAYSVEVCMPANMSIAPWNPEHRRHDFSEEMYLNISLSGFEHWAIQDGVYYSKITVNTTTGYFELPNYMNGEVAGPLLEDDPSNHCGLDCAKQGFDNSAIYDHNLTSRDISNSTEDTAIAATVTLDSNINKGPLLTTALALFGLGSFITKIQSFEEYVSSLNNRSLDAQCLDLVPFVSLLRDAQETPGNILDPCLDYTTARFKSESLAATYLWAFVFDDVDGYDGERIQNAFTTAAFLSNEAWMLGAPPSKSLYVSYDLGADTEVPVISKVGIVLVSTLLCLFLLCLLTLSLYSAWVPRWSTQLDAFAMMRIGAAMREELPLLMTRHVDRVKVLDETPGWIGDATGGEGPVGALAIGAETPLTRRRKYRRYPTG